MHHAQAGCLGRVGRFAGRAVRLGLALTLFPTLAWGQTLDEMKQMLQQVLEQNKALQERVEKLEKDLATPPPAASAAAPPAAAEAKPSEPPPTTGERLRRRSIRPAWAWPRLTTPSTSSRHS